MTFLVPLCAMVNNRSRGDVVTFEELNEGDLVTNQYQSLGVIFNGPEVLKDGFGLNGLEFPPFSGTNVAFALAEPQLGALIRADAVGASWSSVGGRVTGEAAVTLTAFAADSSVLGTVSTPGGNFASNVLGLSPNLLLQIDVANIAYVQFTSVAGFTLDDFRTTAVREPASVMMFGLGLACLACWSRMSRGGKWPVILARAVAEGD